MVKILGLWPSVRSTQFYVIAGAAVIAVLMSFIGKLSALLHSIPTPVLGGLSIALFGVIAASGLKIFS